MLYALTKLCRETARCKVTGRGKKEKDVNRLEVPCLYTAKGYNYMVMNIVCTIDDY